MSHCLNSVGRIERWSNVYHQQAEVLDERTAKLLNTGKENERLKQENSWLVSRNEELQKFLDDTSSALKKKTIALKNSESHDELGGGE